MTEEETQRAMEQIRHEYETDRTAWLFYMGVRVQETWSIAGRAEYLSDCVREVSKAWSEATELAKQSRHVTLPRDKVSLDRGPTTVVPSDA